MNDYKNIFLLRNKTVVINGGFGLIGAEISIALLKVDAKIIIIDKNKNFKSKFEKNIEKKYHKNISYLLTDSSNPKNCKKIINYLKKNKLNIDVFINCSYPKDNFWIKNNFTDLNVNSLIKNINLNTYGYIWFSKCIADLMIKNNNGGSIILLSSIYGVVAQNLSIYKGTSMRENLTYNFIKGGIINYVRSMASYYGQFNIRVNAISPGAVEGPVDGQSIKETKIFIKNYIENNPIKKLGKPKDIAASCIFLSSHASDYITGINLVVDGGWTAI